MSVDIKELREIPIPVQIPSVLGWKEIPIAECGEPLVPLGPFSLYSDIFTDSIYPGERNDSPYLNQPVKGSLITQLVRKSVVLQLRQAQKFLPKGYYLIVFDAYRTLDTQKSLYDLYHTKLKEKCPIWNEDQLTQETQKFVSLPSQDPTKPSPHNTGGAVDLAIMKLPLDIASTVKNLDAQIKTIGLEDWPEVYRLEMRRMALFNNYGHLLNFGAPFDYAGPEASLNYLERKLQDGQLPSDEIAALHNRRILYHLMRIVGFEPYEEEWWHFNSPKSQMGAITASLPYAYYGAATLSPENLAHEQMRKNHRLGSIRIHEGWKPEFDKLGIPNHNFAVASEGVKIAGDLRKTSLPTAAIITP